MIVDQLGSARIHRNAGFTVEPHDACDTSYDDLGFRVAAVLGAGAGARE
ncbi:MAG TPA: hypothetical protein VKA01_01795 [Vicinamibacteria bacterium]|nr:hypothetical protein [Vicinamibacteria bacterium]